VFLLKNCPGNALARWQLKVGARTPTWAASEEGNTLYPNAPPTPTVSAPWVYPAPVLNKPPPTLKTSDVQLASTSDEEIGIQSNDIFEETSDVLCDLEDDDLDLDKYGGDDLGVAGNES